MAATIEINGATLISVKDAAVAVSYTRDYVARLAREGKIVASQVGRQWFVDLTSLKSFSTNSEAHEAIRKNQLRDERKRELVAKQQIENLHATAAQQIKGMRFESVAVAASALCLGLLVGFGSYTASTVYVATAPQLSNSVQGLSEAESYSARVLPVATDVHETLLLTETMQQPVFVTEATTTRLANAGGILLFAQNQPTATEAEVAALFSDEVRVTRTAAHEGTVEYTTASGEVSKYPFVLVPAATERPSATLVAPITFEGL